MPERIRAKNLSQMNLQGILFDKADLQAFNFAWSNFQEAEFGQVNLQNANLKGTDLTSSHIVNARSLIGQRIRQAVTDDKTRLPDYLKDCGK